MTVRILSRTCSLLLGLWTATACATAPATSSGPQPATTSGELGSASTGDWVRLATGGRRAEGHLLQVGSDRVVLRRNGELRAYARADLDTVWVRRGDPYAATKVGALAGLGLATMAYASGAGAGDGDGLRFPTALWHFVLAAGAGVIVDIVRPTSWEMVPLR